MESTSPRDIIKGISQIGALPQTMAAVLEVINNPNAGAKEIADVIARDVSLTTRVLKMVNSAGYGRRQRVSRISEAVTMMGINSIKVLTLSSSVFGMMDGGQSAEKTWIKRISRHLIEVATIARRVAEETRAANPEEAFVAGILHDVGIVVMILYYGERYFDLIGDLTRHHRGLLEIEKQRFGFTHCDVGAELIESWKLPPKLAFSVRNHHDSDEMRIIVEDSSLNDIVALADRITMGPFEETYTSIEENIRFIERVSNKLGLKRDSLNRIRRESVVQSVELAQYLELDTGDLIEILGETNNKLAELYISLEKMYREKEGLLKKLTESSPTPEKASY
jgi:putative nucleotidyltransferase with HDIG domain